MQEGGDMFRYSRSFVDGNDRLKIVVTKDNVKILLKRRGPFSKPENAGESFVAFSKKPLWLKKNGEVQRDVLEKKVSNEVLLTGLTSIIYGYGTLALKNIDARLIVPGVREGLFAVTDRVNEHEIFEFKIDAMRSGIDPGQIVKYAHNMNSSYLENKSEKLKEIIDCDNLIRIGKLFDKGAESDA